MSHWQFIAEETFRPIISQARSVGKSRPISRLLKLTVKKVLLVCEFENLFLAKCGEGVLCSIQTTL